MNWDQIEGNWKQIKGKVTEQWGKLTEDDIEVIGGRREQLAGRLSGRCPKVSGVTGKLRIGVRGRRSGAACASVSVQDSSRDRVSRALHD